MLAIWFSEMRAYRGPWLESWIGRITPAGLVTEFRARLPWGPPALPAPLGAVREDPSLTDLTLRPDGRIWFVNSGEGKLGRYDPKTGDIKQWDSPSGPGSYPYALAVANGAVWYNESAVRPDTLVRFDPKTETFQSWAIPSGKVHAGIIRHMRPTRDGNLLIHQSATNRIIQVNLNGG